MASLISGYKYDIFISYRQKDNKHDGWVTEFFDNLKGELESTFKEEISLYFDINPYDGLLETHDVDESLKDKLKCLVFIPIISRTYCDPRSFAWEHEFKSFVEQASTDQFGLKVKLPNGNVASRVLPVRIYDLDTTDIDLCESVLGGVLRGVEFIYKSAGVNRPLRSQEENPQDNLNHTIYRDQINKVANAIRDIITAIQHYNPQKAEASHEVSKPGTKPSKSKITPIYITSVVALVLIILGILFVPKLFKPTEEFEKSIAVLPFKNDSPEAKEENTSFVNGLMEEILINLQTIKELRVPGRTSVEQFRDNTEKTIPEIAKVLNVNYIVEGSVQKYGNKFRLRVQLIKAKGKEDHLWAKSYEQEINSTDDIFNIQNQIAEAIASELKTVISPEEKQLIKKISTENLDAYYSYMRGKDEYSNFLLYNDKDALNIAEIFYNRALEYDPSYAQAYSGLAQLYWDKHYDEEYFSKNFMDSVLVLAETALSYDNNLAEAYSLRGDYYLEVADYERSIKEYEKTVEINPNYWQAYYGLSILYFNRNRDVINVIQNIQIALKLNHDPIERPRLIHAYSFDLACLFGYYDEALDYEKEALKLTNDSIQFYYNMLMPALFNEKYSDAIRYSERSLALDSSYIYAYSYLAQIYNVLGKNEKSVSYYKKYIANLDNIETVGLRNRHRVGYSYLIAGQKAKAEEYFELQKKYCEESIELNRKYAQDITAYYDLACVYSIRGDKNNAYKNLHIYNNKIGDTEIKGMVWYIKTDPFFDNIRNESEFQSIFREIETKYNTTHEKIRKWLEEKNML